MASTVSRSPAFLSAAAHRLSRGEAPLRVRLYDLIEREEVTVLMRRLRGECPALDVKASARSAKATALLPGPIYSEDSRTCLTA